MENEFLDNIHWLTKEKKEKFKKLKGAANSKVDLNEMRDKLKEYYDSIIPFDYKDVKYQSIDMKDYIAMVEEIERREELEVLEILKKRNIID